MTVEAILIIIKSKLIIAKQDHLNIFNISENNKAHAKNKEL